jgi:hypothetical protein
VVKLAIAIAVMYVGLLGYLMYIALGCGKSKTPPDQSCPYGLLDLDHKPTVTECMTPLRESNPLSSPTCIGYWIALAQAQVRDNPGITQRADKWMAVKP